MKFGQMQLIQASDRDGFWITNIVVYVIAHIADYVRLHIRKHLTGFFDGHRHRKTHSKLLGSFVSSVHLSSVMKCFFLRAFFILFGSSLIFGLQGKEFCLQTHIYRLMMRGVWAGLSACPGPEGKLCKRKKRRGIAEGDERPSGVGAYVLIGVYNKTREGAVLVVVAPVGFTPV